MATGGKRWPKKTRSSPSCGCSAVMKSRLIEERTALINQLQSALHEYYPAALEAFEDWTLPSAWAFVESFPTPHALQAAGKRRWEKFLHSHKLARPQTYARRMAIFARAD